MTAAVLGEALIDLIIGDDGTYGPHLGGSPFNVAIGLARQGVEVSYLSPLSNDTFGNQLKNALEAEGVTLPRARRSHYPTSLALVTIDEQAMPTYRLYREGIADKDITIDELRCLLPSDLQVFHTGSLAITPSQLPKIRALFEILRDQGVVISVDINIRLGASIDTDAYLNGVRELLPMADIVKASDEDLEPFGFSDRPFDAARIAFNEMCSGLFALTQGANGAHVFTADGVVSAGGFAVDTVADTVGAGDTFHSAFLAFLDRADVWRSLGSGLPETLIEAATEHACAAAAINVSRVGCQPPTRQEVEALLATRNG